MSETERTGKPRSRWQTLSLWRVALSLGVPLVIVAWSWAFGAGVEFENGRIVARLVGPPPCDRPFRDGCDEPAHASDIPLAAPDDCAAARTDICFIPLGATDLRMLDRWRDHYERSYGVRVVVLPPVTIHRDAYVAERGQFSIDRLVDIIEAAYPATRTEPVLAIGVTPVDMYIPAIERWRFAFGGLRPNTTDGALAVVSTHRMQAEEWAIWPGEIPLVFRYGYNAALVEDRARKMTTKYLGLAHFGLEPSDDPVSPMFNGILSVRDLDLMGAVLELAADTAGRSGSAP